MNDAHPRAFSVILSAAFLACTDVADDRVARDEAVGHYFDGSTRIDIDDGLAVVRDVSRGAIVLWSSAPAWSGTLVVDDSEPLRLELRNTLDGSTVAAQGPDGEVLEVEGASKFELVDVEERLPTQLDVRIMAPRSPMRLQLIPPPANSDVVRFAVLSDIQEAIGRVQDIYRSIARESPAVDFVLSAGDLTRRGTKDELERFEHELRGLPVPYYCTLGNHELGDTPPPYHDWFGRGSLHFRFRGVAFSLLDSASATLAPRSFEWLRGWLEDNRSRVHVFAAHIPPVDPIGVRNGSFASRAEAHQLLAALAEGRVDLSLYGHIHSYYEFTLAGIPSYIAGGGGAIPERFDRVGRHYLVVEARVTEDSSGKIESVRLVEVD